MSISAFALTTTSPTRRIDIVPTPSTSPIPGWCESDSWIGTLFIEGVGPVPDQPVILEYSGDTSEHRLIVEPGRNTVRANAGFVVEDDQLSVPEPRERTMLVELARASDEAFPLIVHTNGTSVRAFASGRPFVMWPVNREQLEQSEWRAYFLSAIPGSEPWAAEGPRCNQGVPR